MPEVYVKSIRRGRELLVAVCDAEILGKTLTGWRVPFKVKESFYKGIPAKLDEALEAIGKATICNLVGKRIVEAAIRKGLINKYAVIYIGEIPHAQIVSM